MGSLLDIRRLTIVAGKSRVPVVRELSISVERGECVGLVGASGCGKSTTALSILGLLPRGLSAVSGEILLDGVELRGASLSVLRSVRGERIGLVFQEPLAALNPVLTIGRQLREVIREHSELSAFEARREAAQLLEMAGVPDALKRLKSYAHELSGGLRQRVMVALALAGRPDLLIADEPTSALDTTLQAELLELLASLREELGLAVLLISHDLEVVASSCQRVYIMYAGEIVEQAPAADLFSAAAHPYTRHLLGAVERPSLRSAPTRGKQGLCPYLEECCEIVDECGETPPPRRSVGADHFVRCLRPGDKGPRL